MNHSEVAKLLALAAGRDQRTVGETDVLAWHEDVGDLDFVEAREALRRHFRDSTDRLMPAHIRAGVRVIREERRRLAAKAPARELPSRFEADEERDARLRKGVARVRAAIAPILAKWSMPRERR